jgi:hypothetical protein
MPQQGQHQQMYKENKNTVVIPWKKVLRLNQKLKLITSVCSMKLSDYVSMHATKSVTFM